MSEENQVFTASNGWTIGPPDSSEDRLVEDSLEGFQGYLSEQMIQALREFFAAERDAELGRWRDPEDLDWTVTPRGDDHFNVINEVVARSYMLRAEEALKPYRAPNYRATSQALVNYRAAKQVLARYLAAHEPKQCGATCRVGGVVHQCWLDADHDGGHTMTEDGFTLSWGGDAL